MPPGQGPATTSPKASQSGFSHTKPESRTFDVSAGRAVTPQEGQIGALPTSLSSGSLIQRDYPRLRSSPRTMTPESAKMFLRADRGDARASIRYEY